jgi:hypothetical protein
MAKRSRSPGNSLRPSRSKSHAQTSTGGRQPRVIWLNAADRVIQRNLKPLFSRELATAFPDAKTVTVCDYFQGYTRKQDDKVVLGVEVEGAERYDSHIVKLGIVSKVGSDYGGFQACISGRPFASRIFVNVAMRELGDDRLAVIYENAYQFYGDDTDRHNPRELDEVVAWAIKDDKPDPQSVQRVIRQVFGDLYRWFYHSAEDSPRKARAFLEKRLAKDGHKRAVLNKWNKEPDRLDLRRDVNWLLCGQDASDSSLSPLYLDPFAYVSWALDHDSPPQMLVGSSHGDLHGRNILVGVQRGEAEYPAVFDYGEMGTDNALIWDFVKLETELKVRMIPFLMEDETVCSTLLAQPCFPKHLHRYFDKTVPVPTGDATAWEAKREFAFAFAFERCLACLTNSIHRTAAPSIQCEGLAAVGGRGDKLRRALAIFHGIRSEASVWLGEKQLHRGGHGRWRDEYYFGLAAYGLATARFDYKPYETGFALISAGVAAAQLAAASATYPATETKTASAPCSYQTPLKQAYQLWKRGGRSQLRRALQILDTAVGQFPYAVPLQRERALVKAALGDHKTAQDELKPLVGFCRSFFDYETLSRIGRTYKDLGDSAWASKPRSYEQLKNAELPARQWYATGYEFYREAFDFSRHYFPGINAAFLAHFILENPEEVARHLAHEVAAICATLELGKLPGDEPFWVLCTEGEAVLIAGDAERSANFYEQALLRVSRENAGMVQIPYNQLCRLYKLLGEEQVSPVVKVFVRSGFPLKPGPLGNCGSRTK